MKKKSSIVFLVVLAALLLCLSVGVTLAKYTSTMTDNSLTISIDGREYVPMTITSKDTDAYSTSGGVRTIYPTYFDKTKNQWCVVVGIAENGFKNSGSGVTTLVLPNTLETIGKDAFCSWTSLKVLHLPASVTSFSPSANMNALTAYTVEEGSTTYSAKDGVLYNKDGTYLIRYPKGKTEEHKFFTVPDAVTAIDPGAFDGNSYLLAIMVTSHVDYVTEAAWGAHSQTLAICDKLGVDIADIRLSDGTYTVTLKDNTLDKHEITQTGQSGTQHDLVDGDTFALLPDAYGSGKWLIFEESVNNSYAYVLLDSNGTVHMYAGMAPETLPEVGSALPVIEGNTVDTSVTVKARFKMPTHLPSATHWPDDVEFSDWSYLQDTENPVVKAVVVETKITPSSTANWFRNFRICTSFNLAKLDTSRVTNMSNMFVECRAVETLDLSTFDTAFVTDMSGMFNTCYNLKNLNLSGFKTPRATSMENMFNNCRALETLDLTGFSNAKLTNVNGMFNGASKLKTVYVGSEWAVKDMTGTPFSGNTAPLTGSRGTEFKEGMTTATYARVDNDMGAPGYFTYQGEPLIRCIIDGVSITAQQNADGTVTLVLTGDPIPEAIRIISTKNGVANESYTVHESAEGQNFATISGHLYTEDQIICVYKEDPVVFGVLGEDNVLRVRTGAVNLKGDGTATFTDETGALITCSQDRIYSAPTDIEGFAKGSGALWNTAYNAVKVEFLEPITPVNSTVSWFNGLSNCKEIDLSKVDFSSVTNMNYMFSGCSSLTDITWPADTDISKVTDMTSMFEKCTSLKTVRWAEGLNTASLKNMNNMFSGCTSLTAYPLPEDFSTQTVTSMENLFKDCTSLGELILPASFNTENVKMMQNMFNGCKALKSITWSANFKTGNVQRMDGMFSYCESLETLALPATFDTQNVTSMSNMFGYCYKLKNLSFDASTFNTSKVRSMGGMFRSCYELTDEDFYEIFSYFTETTALTNIGAIFNGCTSLKNFVWPEVLNTSKVTYMREVFQFLKELESNLETVDLTNLDTTANTNIMQFFNGCTKLTTIYVSSSWNADQIIEYSSVFSNCNNLVGGNGTKYESSNASNPAYARIDGENGLPGYFTLKEGDVTPANITINVDPSVAGGHTVNGWIFLNKEVVIKLTDPVSGVMEVALKSEGSEAIRLVSVNPTDHTVTIPAGMITDGAVINVGTYTSNSSITINWQLADYYSFIERAPITVGQDYVVTLIADAGHELPMEPPVYFNDEDGGVRTGVAFDPTTGVLTIAGRLITNDIHTITIYAGTDAAAAAASVAADEPVGVTATPAGAAAAAATPAVEAAAGDEALTTPNSGETPDEDAATTEEPVEEPAAAEAAPPATPAGEESTGNEESGEEEAPAPAAVPDDPVTGGETPEPSGEELPAAE